MNRPRSVRLGMASLAAILLLVGIGARAQACGGGTYPDPFEDARHVPSTVTQYFCFVEAGESLSELMDSPLGPGLKAFYERGQSGQSWKDLAAATGIESAKLFDMLVSRRVTLVTDQDPAAHAHPAQGPDFSRWVMMARVEEPFARELLKMLGGRVRQFVDDTPLYAADNGSLRFAYLDGRFYLAAANGEALLRSMLVKSMGSTLADDEEFREARGVGPGDFGMFKRGEDDGHWQAGAAKVRRSRMFINFSSRHEARGQERDPDDAINLGLLDTLSENAIYVGIERTPDANDPPCERSAGPGLLALVPIARAKPEMLTHLGPTMFTVIESPDAAGGETGIPAMTVGIEMRQPAQAVGELDEFMGAATTRLARRGRNPAEESAPAAVFNAGGPPEALRSAEWRSVGMPMKMLGLQGAWPERVVWSSVQSDDRSWWLASTDEQSQRRIAAKLLRVSSACRKGAATLARGAVFGDRAAALIAQWPAVNAATENRFMAELFAWRELLAAVSEIRWRVTQSSPERTETGILVAWNSDSDH